jgi:hypothetical protein
LHAKKSGRYTQGLVRKIIPKTSPEGQWPRVKSGLIHPAPGPIRHPSNGLVFRCFFAYFLAPARKEVARRGEFPAQCAAEQPPLSKQPANRKQLASDIEQKEQSRPPLNSPALWSKNKSTPFESETKQKKILKFRSTRSDKDSNGDEKSKPGPGTKG